MQFRLTQRHLDAKDQDAQNVRLAAQVFSKSTALALKYIFPEDAEMQELSEFILVVDEWFDTCNSRTKFDNTKPHRCALRVHWPKQKRALEKAIDVFTKLRAGRKKAMMPWQKGLLISTKSMILLYTSLLVNYSPMWYFHSARVNQDFVENTFSILRLIRGHMMTFGALSFIQRLRDHILGGCTRVAVESASVHCPNDGDQMLTEDVSMELLTAEEPPIEDNITLEGDILDDVDGILTDFSSDTPQPSISVSQEQGYIYLGGYLARSSGEVEHYRTKNDDKDATLYQSSGWLDDKNTAADAGGRGLCYPSKILTLDLREMELEFVAFHGIEGLPRTPGVVKAFADHLQNKFPHYCMILLKKFSKVRIIIRMRRLNVSLKACHDESARSKRKKIERSY
jgi:hypothetical protein